ncbi:MAG: 30S ribosomal protein S8 [Thermodesulfobacteriota bacterium]
MTMTDPIADLLTRIRNAIGAKHPDLTVPGSKLKCEVARILKEEGYITDAAFTKDNKQGTIKIKLKYAPSKKSVITNIRRVSKPGCRVYVGSEDVPRILNGLGVAILSTSKGVITDSKARELKVGGEVLCSVY